MGREIIRNHISSTDLKGVVEKLTKSEIGNDIRKSCQLTFPLKVCLIEKVKVLRKPKKDVAKLMAMHDLTVGFDELVEIILTKMRIKRNLAEMMRMAMRIWMHKIYILMIKKLTLMIMTFPFFFLAKKKNDSFQTAIKVI